MSASSVVVLPGGVLVSSSPVGALQDVSGLDGLVEDERGDEVPDLGQAHCDEAVVDVASRPLFARVTVRKAWASMERVMCRCQPVYCRTW